MKQLFTAILLLWVMAGCNYGNTYPTSNCYKIPDEYHTGFDSMEITQFKHHADVNFYHYKGIPRLDTLPWQWGIPIDSTHVLGIRGVKLYLPAGINYMSEDSSDLKVNGYRILITKLKP